MREIGFSTGAVALDDFRGALSALAAFPLQAIEVSALRVRELRPLIDSIPTLDLSHYRYISLHVPSAFSAMEEVDVVSQLMKVPLAWTLIVHPDSIHNHALWRELGSRVAIENMDRRKRCGRTAAELMICFDKLPDARLCFDVGHARQFDPSMAEAYVILKTLSHRLIQVHASEVDAQSRHAVITYAAELAFSEIAHLIPDEIPIILESRVSLEQIGFEVEKARFLFPTRSVRQLQYELV